MMTSLLGALLPTTCPACGASGAAPCASCWRLLKPAPAAAPPAGLLRCRSLLLYEGAGRELVARLKYRNARSALGWLASGMAELARGAVTDLGVDVVTWAPTSAERRRRRGYDQAQLLADEVARPLGLPCLRLLRRLPGPPQTGRSRAERWQGPTFRPARCRSPLGVLLVDDLLTTGATLSAAAAALHSSGTTTVIGLTAGRTPLKLSTP